MKLENQVVNKELSKRIEGLGIIQDCLYYWVKWRGEFKVMEAYDNDFTKKEYYPAYTVAELWDLLPYGTQLNKGLAFGNPIVEYGKNIDKKSIQEVSTRKEGQKVADALARLLINLKENK